MGRSFRRALSVRVLVVVALVAVSLPAVHAASAAPAVSPVGIAERLAKLIHLDAARRPTDPKVEAWQATPKATEPVTVAAVAKGLGKRLLSYGETRNIASAWMGG